MHRKRFLLLIVLMICTTGSSVFSQHQLVNPDSALLNTLTRLPGSRLRLQYAVEQALQNATDLRAAEAAYRTALGVVRQIGRAHV